MMCPSYHRDQTPVQLPQGGPFCDARNGRFVRTSVAATGTFDGVVRVAGRWILSRGRRRPDRQPGRPHPSAATDALVQRGFAPGAKGCRWRGPGEGGRPRQPRRQRRVRPPPPNGPRMRRSTRRTGPARTANTMVRVRLPGGSWIHIPRGWDPWQRQEIPSRGIPGHACPLFWHWSAPFCWPRPPAGGRSTLRGRRPTPGASPRPDNCGTFPSGCSWPA